MFLFKHVNTPLLHILFDLTNSQFINIIYMTRGNARARNLVLRKEQMRRREKAAAVAVAASDTISKLLNDILCRILSFLTTKEAVATSILSKRWTHLWISVPDINFTNIRVHSIKSNHKFNESVYSVLTSRDTAGYNVDSFHLDIQYGDSDLAYKYGFPNIFNWINFVVQRKLKYLLLNHDLDEQEVDVYLPKLPISIFTCKTLVSLNLCRFRVESFSFSFIGFEFPLLKTLHLNNIDFDEDRDFVLLLSGCSDLEDLQLFHVSLPFEVNFLVIEEFKSLTLPKLVRADISQCFWYSYPLKALSTSKSLCLDRLKLSTEDDKVNQLQHLYDDIPIFHNLTHLEFRESWDLVIQMLHHLPKLQNLELYKSLWSRVCIKTNSVRPEFVPQCLLSCLRTCTIRHIRGTEHRLVTYILKNARILQTMKVWIQGKQEQPKLERKLFQCPKASATCQLLVY